MVWSLIPGRRDEPELMDAPGLAESEVAAAYQVLGKINRLLGNTRTMRRELQRFIAEDCSEAAQVTLLDVGSGAGDILWTLRETLVSRAIAGVAVALDHDPTAVELAHHRLLAVVQGDALRLPFADRALDLVIAIKFAHHFSGAALSGLVAEMARVARRRVIVLDIRRHWLAYWGFVAWSRVWTRNRLVRYDGPLSVLRAFTPAELIGVTTTLPTFDWTVRSYAGFQLALVGRRRTGIVLGRSATNAAAPGMPGDSASPATVGTS